MTLDPKSSASANSAIPAANFFIITKLLSFVKYFIHFFYIYFTRVYKKHIRINEYALHSFYLLTAKAFSLNKSFKTSFAFIFLYPSGSSNPELSSFQENFPWSELDSPVYLL